MKQEQECSKRVQPLSDVFSEVPDPRSDLGKRYPMQAILNLAVAAMLCGHDNPNQIATYGGNQSPTLLRILGFPRGKAPGKSTLYDLFRRMDEIAFEERLGAWAEQVLAELTDEEEEQVGIALDGETLRGSAKQGAANTHLHRQQRHSTTTWTGQRSGRPASLSGYGSIPNGRNGTGTTLLCYELDRPGGRP